MDWQERKDVRTNFRLMVNSPKTGDFLLKSENFVLKNNTISCINAEYGRRHRKAGRTRGYYQQQVRFNVLFMLFRTVFICFHIFLLCFYYVFVLNIINTGIRGTSTLTWTSLRLSRTSSGDGALYSATFGCFATVCDCFGADFGLFWV